MNEIETTAVDETTDIDDWSDIVITDEDIAGATEDGMETIGEGAENGAADQPAEEATEQTENTETENSEAEADQFVLKHLGEEKEVNRDEVITLAQKGMDYDRIRGKHDELVEENTNLKAQMSDYEQTKEQLDYFREIAEASGLSLDELIVQTLAAQRASRNGTSVDAELPRVKLDMERKSLEKDKSNWERTKGAEQTAAQAEADKQAQILADLEQFAAEFPEVAKDVSHNVPQEVWDAVNAGNTTLTAEYRKYDAKLKDAEIANLKSQLEQATQNEKNKLRSTGSQSSDSVAPTGDMWDAAWAEN